MGKIRVDGKDINKKTQLHDVTTYDVNNIVFADAESGEVPNQPIKYHRINVLTKNADGSMGDLILEFPRMFSFGVQVQTDAKTFEPIGLSMSMCLTSKGVTPTHDEQKSVDFLTALIEKCKDHVLTVKKTIAQPRLERSHLDPMDKLIYRKQDASGEYIQGEVPTFSPKLLELKERIDPKTKKITPKKMLTVFYKEGEVDSRGEGIEVDVTDYISTKETRNYCYVRPAVKIDNIYIGAGKISIQCKLSEASVEPASMGTKRLLKTNRPVYNAPTSIPLITAEVEQAAEESEQEEDDDDEEVAAADEDMADEEPEPEVVQEPVVEPKKMVKKIVRVVKKVVKV